MKHLIALVLTLATALFSIGSHAQCQFDQFGTITNPNDSSCRDARFEFTENNSSGNNIAVGYPIPSPVNSLTGVAGFRSYASLHARHQDLMMTDANLRGTIVGQTLTGRDIWAYQLGDADNLTNDGRIEPALMINGGIHAREWQSPEAVTEVLEQLLEIDADSGLGQYLSDNVNLIIVPVLNIDGFIQTQSFPSSVAASAQQPRDGRMRRKNLRNPSGGAPVDNSLTTSSDQFLGVDLNRNSVHGYGLNNRSSTDPVSLVNRGTAPASEPEIQALQAAAALGPADRLRFYADLHSFTRVFFSVRTGNARLDAMTSAVANRMRAASGNRYFNSPSGVGGEIGLTSDYFALEYQIPSWTLEIEPLNGGQDYTGGTGASHSGFILPDSEVPRMRDEIATMLLLGYYRMAGPPAVTAAQITRVSDNTVVYRADWNTDVGGLSRSLTVSTNAGLDEGERYSLWVGFDKPMRYTTDGVTAINYTGQPLNPFGVYALDSGPDAGDLSIDLTGDATNWLAQPGGAPAGYQRYRFDAVAAEFDVPALTADIPLTLSIFSQDIAQTFLDADPSTPVDFANGGFSGYEDPLGVVDDSGGADCSLSTFARMTGSTAAAPAPVTCKAAAVAAPPPPPPPAPVPPPATGGGGGGGGAMGPTLLLMLLWRRRRD